MAHAYIDRFKEEFDLYNINDVENDDVFNLKHRNSIAVVCIAKDEDLYIDEWLNYHLKLGIDRIYLYQNNWRYSGKISDNRITLIEFDGQQMQQECYNRALEDYSSRHDFITFIDVDEFIVINDGINIHSWLETLKNFDDIYVNWRLFGDSGFDKVNGEYSVLKRFTKCSSTLSRLGKNILHTSSGTKMYVNNPHIVLEKTNQNFKFLKYADTNGKSLTTPPWTLTDIDEHQNVELFHFRNKTYQECYDRKFGKDDVFWKKEDAKVCHDIETFNREFMNHNKNDVENTKARDFLYV